MVKEIVKKVLSEILGIEVREEDRGETIEFFAYHHLIAYLCKVSEDTVYLWNKNFKTPQVLERLKIQKSDEPYTRVDIKVFLGFST